MKTQLISSGPKMCYRVYSFLDATQPVLDYFKHVVSCCSPQQMLFSLWSDKACCSIGAEQEGLFSSGAVWGFNASVFVKRTHARSSYGLLKRGPAPPSHWCTSTIRHAPLPLFHHTRPSSRHTRNKQGSVFCSSIMWKRQSYFLSALPHTSPAWPLWEEKLKTNCRLLIWYLIYFLPSV